MAISISSGTVQVRGQQPESVTRVRTVERALFVMSLVMFAAVIFAWIGVQAFTAQVRGETGELQKRQGELRKDRLAERDEQLLATVARVENIAKNLRFHQDGRAALSFLEERVQPGVVFSGFSVDYVESSMTVTAIGPNVAAIARQMAYFEESPNVRRVTIDGASRESEGGGVSVSFEILFSSDAFLAKFAP